MGALNSNLVTNYHQGWRLVTAMWLHGGVVHLVCNLLGIAFLLNRLEKEFGLCSCVVIGWGREGEGEAGGRGGGEGGLDGCESTGEEGIEGKFMGGGLGAHVGRPTAIYLLSGFFAAVFSCLFLDTQISVGASGALFGLVGACLSELLIKWKLYDNRVWHWVLAFFDE
ncbi:unnamed protein product [Closterium sp. Naga37s-1]|nr:unnamed protein product [Closterium sp. Naga37s-1]